MVARDSEVWGRQPRLRSAVRRYWAAAIIGGLAVTVLVAMLVAGMTSATAFEPYNPDWDGTSDFRSDVTDDPDVEAVIATDTSQYEAGNPNETVAIVLTPDEPYTWSDADRVQAFVENGGTLVILENFGEQGNGLLARVGAEARFNGQILLDERENHRGPAMPLATEVATHALTEDVEHLSLNYGTAVEPGNATVLVSTSEYGYLGTDETDEPGRDDELAAYPVATTEDVGNGTVVAVGDPSIAINVMYDHPDNARFLANQYEDAGRVIFDRSHAPSPPPLTAAVLAIRTTPALQLLIGLTGVICVAAVAHVRIAPRTIVRQVLSSSSNDTGTSAVGESVLSDEELIAALRRENPDRDPEHVRTVVTALGRDNEKRGNDNDR